MANIKFFLFAAVLCALTVHGQGGLTTQAPVTITVPKASVPPASSSSDVPTEMAPTSTDSKPTPDPITTSTGNPTTPKPTPPPTTTTSTTTTTTEPPTTTTTTTHAPAPAPTPKPGPLPAPTQGKWSYADKTTNAVCILTQFAAQMNVTYTKAVNGSTELAYVIFNMPANATVAGGNCNSTEQWLNITWPATGVNSMVLIFASNQTTKTYALKTVNLTLDATNFPDAASQAPVKLWHGLEWQTPLATSYRCMTPTQLNMTADATVATLTLSQLQEEAFRDAKTEQFSAAKDCGGGDIPDAVPIAVGCALGGLVVVVLVAYLIGRRRSAARGYLSM